MVSGVNAAPISQVAAHFDLVGEYDSADIYGSGHIHDTFLVGAASGGGERQYILQRINTHVFPGPVLLMSNIERVLTHIRQKIALLPGDVEMRCLNLIPTKDGESYHIDEYGEYWRMYDFIDGASTINRAKYKSQVVEAAAAFGRFQAMLADLPPPTLYEVIPDFHNTPERLAQLEEAVQRDEANRAKSCQAEIETARAFGEQASRLTDLLASGELPQRVVHNDTKINNVMFDDLTGKAVCVIDVDTVMPGLSLYDFGDLVRSAAVHVDEGEKDVSKVKIRMDLFKSIADGFLSTAGEFLTETEIANLHHCGETITGETALRFLTDYLDGDIYFKVDSLYQNLERCRAQFALAESMARRAAEMQDIVGAAAEKYRSAG